MEIRVSVPRQELVLCEGPGNDIRRYMVSTASNGVGETNGSGCTPRGRHIVRAKIGAGQPLGAVFVARRPTGEVWSEDLQQDFPERDWILTRILWLSGTEPGFNRLGPVDSMRRYIYIHGTPERDRLGLPVSHGCIRMANEDVADLFARVPVGISVVIDAYD